MEWLDRCAELFKKSLECASGFALVLGTLVFANAVDLSATGLNSYAVLYEKESQKLGTNAAAITELRRQLTNIKDVNDSLLRQPPPQNVGKFVDATADLIDALWQIEQAEEETSHIDLVTYKPNEDPIPNLTVPLPSASPGPGEAEITLQVLLWISKFAEVQRQAEETERSAAELWKDRDQAMVRVAESISLVLGRAQRLTPPEKAKLLQAIVQRLVALVTRDGIERAAQEIRDLVRQKQQEAEAQRQANDTRRADVTQFRQGLQGYMTQQKACLDTANAVANFLLDGPDGPLLIPRLNAYQPRANIPRAPLLQRPTWQTKSPRNDDLEKQFIREISRQLYNRPNPPDEDYFNVLRRAFGNAGGNTEAPGFGLLASWIEDGCSHGQSPETVIAALRQRAHQTSPL
jgi:hypothetical protein